MNDRDNERDFASPPLGEEAFEGEDHADLQARLAAYTLPEPDTARLLAALKPIWAEQTAGGVAEPLPTLTARRPSVWEAWRGWLRLARLQTQIIEARFAWASLLVIGIGVLLASTAESAGTVLFLLLFSPLVAILGVALLFRPSSRTLWELEQFSGFRPFEFLYVRLALIVLFNIGGALGLLVVVGTQGVEIVLWRLLLIWLGPLIGLTGIALWCSVRWNSLIGLVVPMMVWIGLVGIGWRQIVLAIQPDSLNFIRQLTFSLGESNLLVGLSGLLLGVGILSIIEAGRRVSQWH